VHGLQRVAFIEVWVCFLAICLIVIRGRRPSTGQQKVVRAPASRWGFVLVLFGFVLTGVGSTPKPVWSLVISIVLGPLSVALVWSAVRHLGKQWRFEAALNADHELIQTGPYRFVRHPIYAALLLFVLQLGTAWTWWPAFAGALAFFLAGTEIRVRAEDRLLAERFQ
jgi:protein-S-isoprenylcysteine O-methyltransferase Ste14